MTHRVATNYAKNYCNRTPIVKVIVENVVTCFFGTQCMCEVAQNDDLPLQVLVIVPTYHIIVKLHTTIGVVNFTVTKN